MITFYLIGKILISYRFKTKSHFMKKEHYDVFVIGSGIAGQTAAKICAKEGLKVAISDDRAFGGTCANRGCDPKKILISFGELMDFCERMKKNGIATPPELDWKAVQNFKRSFTDKIPKRTEEKLEDLGISMYHQSPEFVNENEIKVEGKFVTANKFVIATGCVPRKLDFTGSNLLKTSDDFLNLEKLPKTAVFIGSGYIGMEFSHLLATLGCKVTIIDIAERLLLNFDEDLTNLLQKKSEQKGINFHFDSKVVSIKKLQKNHKITIENSNGEKLEIKAELVFNTSGRIPSTEKLKLAKANISENKNVIEVNQYMQSISNKNVYACGDVSDFSLKLTPLSGLEGYVAANNILKEKSKKLLPPLVPSVVFTLPQMATVGLSEKEAKSLYKNVIVNYKEIPFVYNATRQNEDIYAYKVLINEDTQTIVGAHLIGPKAGETINLFALAIKNEIKIIDIKRSIFTYPSFANDIRKMV